MPSIEELRRYAVARGQDVANMSDAELLAFYNANEYGDDDAAADDAPPPLPPEDDDDDAPTGGSLDAIIGDIAAKVARKVAAEVAAEHSRPSISVVVPQPDDAPDIVIEGAHQQFQELLIALRNDEGYPVLLTGAAGGGKTTACRMAAKALAREWFISGPIADRYMDWLGHTDAHGTYHATAYSDAFRCTRPAFLCVDEIDASNPNDAVAANAVFAGETQQRFPGIGICERGDLMVAATANTWHGATREFTGRNQLDAATRNRFIEIEWRYDDALERAMAANEAWVDRVQAIRRAVTELDVRGFLVTPRASQAGASLIRGGLTWDRAEELAIWKGTDKATRTRIEECVRAN